jgi:hypothetical protein
MLIKTLLAAGAIASTALAAEPCRIEIIERGTGWPVPLVELRTTHSLRFLSDNNGLIACDAPELMGREVWFDVLGHGYEVRKDGFGMRGVRLTPEPGKKLRIEVDRKIIAKRLGRITGAGIFGESQKLGLEKDWNESGVFGCDSVQNAAHNGFMFWAWGDTTMPNYPLGIFDASSATTAVQPLPAFQPPIRLKLDYFTDSRGRARGVAPMSGSGPTWLSGYVSLPDKNGKSHLVSSYTKIKPPLEAYEVGLCVWQDEDQKFERLKVLWTKSDKEPKAPPFPDGHPSLWTDSQGKEWVLFGNPLPTLRCPRTFEAWQDSSKWERLTPQATIPTRDGKSVKPHSGHITWNGYRKSWVTVFMEGFGKPSVFGELWFAEAQSPLGPWEKAVKVLTHENYTFYNPRLHPAFTPTNSPILIFEGTYTADFADKPHPTPRYNYNQVLYRLDLDDL